MVKLIDNQIIQNPILGKMIIYIACLSVCNGNGNGVQYYVQLHLLLIHVGYSFVCLLPHHSHTVICLCSVLVCVYTATPFSHCHLRVFSTLLCAHCHTIFTLPFACVQCSFVCTLPHHFHTAIYLCSVLFCVPTATLFVSNGLPEQFSFSQ